MSLRCLTVRALLACAASLTIALPARAQAVPLGAAESAGGGTWLSAGAGGGWARVNCSICRTDRFAGPSVAVRVGTTLRPGLLISAEVDGWTRSNDDVRSMLVAGSGAAWIYPDPDRGFFLKAGAGLVHYGLDEDAGTNLLGLMLGAGYEMAIGERLSITNSIGLIASSFGSIVSDDGVVAEDVSVSVIHFGIALTRR
jgi:hypothetical protein